MRDKLVQISESLKAIGLEDAASYIQKVGNLYVLAAEDFSTEIGILNSLAATLEELKELKYHDIYKGNQTLPAYSIDSHNERIVKSSESLQGYSKKEILAGINQYLQSFIKNYMAIKVDRITYNDTKKYVQAMHTITSILHEFQAAHRGVSKGSISKLLFKVLRSTQDIDLFLRIVKREIPKIDDPRWTGPLARSLPSQALIKIEGSTWSEALSNLDFDLESEMRKIEEEYMHLHDIAPADFYQMIKSFRANVSETRRTASIRKADKNDEEDTLDLSDKSNSESTSKTSTPPPKSDFLKRPGSGLLSYNPLALEEPTNLRSVATQIVTSGSLFSKSKSGPGNKLTPLSPTIVYRVYSQFLLSQFREQYASLINTASQIHASVYQVQAVEQKLIKALYIAARELR